MDIDHKGRIWVAEGRNYRGSRSAPDGDRIVVIEDKDGNGTADSSHVFVQETGFISPLGIAVVDKRIIVSQRPEMVPFDISDELHLKFDAVAINYRRTMKKEQLV